jgi:DNA repair exonuclease SbcCD ATPase subunit
MNKTKVDDMLIEMIKPKIEEIEKKFTSNQPLTQDDINTLLLKSQYNHINHLDQKLNETVDSVKNLEFRFEKLEAKFDSTIKELKNNYERLEDKFDSTVKELRNDYKVLEQNIQTTIQKALNKNMMTLIIVIGAFLTLSKIIDKF